MWSCAIQSRAAPRQVHRDTGQREKDHAKPDPAEPLQPPPPPGKAAGEPPVDRMTDEQGEGNQPGEHRGDGERHAKETDHRDQHEAWKKPVDRRNDQRDERDPVEATGALAPGRACGGLPRKRRRPAAAPALLDCRPA
ncbi:hypothetical protein SDC9_21363 [bioreactor metagenome]|uniref:Uncharacterized protein n=1 Tax=bioreactor metagenome TaxID=1076179 RepID=A0A644U9B9_9ZZZZ